EFFLMNTTWLKSLRLFCTTATPGVAAAGAHGSATGHTLKTRSKAQQRIMDFLASFPEGVPVDRIRNFSVIAHVDHGKSTLCDRLLNMTGIETKGAQYLDTLEVERERGITIKAQSCSILYDNPKDGLTYLLNLIDTPGHTDFQYEVARSLSACQGAILLVDAIQGVQAQTVANFYLAFMQQGLEVIGALNKIDVEHVDLSSSRSQLASLMDVDESAILGVSAKTGKNVDHLLT
ncbi:Translation factor guf1 mitochondrial, partial [Perkinsus olseni]